MKTNFCALNLTIVPLNNNKMGIYQIVGQLWEFYDNFARLLKKCGIIKNGEFYGRLPRLRRRPSISSLINSWLDPQKALLQPRRYHCLLTVSTLTSTYTFIMEICTVAAMECLKDCCKKFTKKKGREYDAQGIRMASYTAACRSAPVLVLWCDFVSPPLFSSDRAEDASEGIGVWAGWREEGGHRRLPPVQAAPGRQGRAVRPADLQGLVHPAQGLLQCAVWSAEYVPSARLRSMEDSKWLK